MTSSNQDDKNLSSLIENDSEDVHADATATPRDEHQHSPYYRDFRTDDAVDAGANAQPHPVTRLAGLLYTFARATDDSPPALLPATEDGFSRTGREAPVDEDAAAVRAADGVSTWSTPKSQYATAVVPDGGIYGVTQNGQPMVASKQMEMTALTNTGGQPHDTLLEPDALDAAGGLSLEDASPHELVEPTGDRIVGVASGLDEHVSRLRAYDAPDGASTEASSTGIATADLEVSTPDGSIQRLGDVVDEPERFARSSIETIEATLALEAELRSVSDGILAGGELVGHAKWLHDRFEMLAATRPSAARIAAVRERNARRAYRARIRPLTDLDEETSVEVRSLARRLTSDEFDRVHELRKSPLTVALELAKRVHRGTDPTHALLEQADAEATDPRNVVAVGNVRYTRTATSGGRVSTQGEVKLLFENTHPQIKQAGVLRDETGEIRFAIFAGSERDELAPTADPTDPGFTVVTHRSFPELCAGDTVRFESVFKNWYRGEATIETRRDSEVTIVKRGSSRIDQVTEPTPRRSRPTRKTRPTSSTPVPRPPIASWRGSERWIFPTVEWMQDWWFDSEDVEAVTPVTDDDHDAHAVCGSRIDSDGERRPRCYRVRTTASEDGHESSTTHEVKIEAGHVVPPQNDLYDGSNRSDETAATVDFEALYEAVWEDHEISQHLARTSARSQSSRSVLAEQVSKKNNTETL